MNAAIAPLVGNGMASLAARFRANAGGGAGADTADGGPNALGIDSGDPADFASLLHARRGNDAQSDDDESWLALRATETNALATDAITPPVVAAPAPPAPAASAPDVEAIFEQIDPRGASLGDAAGQASAAMNRSAKEEPPSGEAPADSGLSAEDSPASLKGRTIAAQATGVANATGERPGQAASAPAAEGLARLIAAASSMAPGDGANNGTSLTTEKPATSALLAGEHAPSAVTAEAQDTTLESAIGATSEAFGNFDGESSLDNGAGGEQGGGNLASNSSNQVSASGALGTGNARLQERVEMPVNTPLRAPDWSGEVGQRVVWMARNDVQEAQLTINPPHLGPIEVRLSLSDDRASAQFFSPHAEVREVLQEALPRLREMLAGAGVQLGQSDVGAQSQQAFQQPGGARHGGSNGRSFAEEHPSLGGDTAVNEVQTSRVVMGNGLVDTFV